jgi:hypothetical protein
LDLSLYQSAVESADIWLHLMGGGTGRSKGRRFAADVWVIDPFDNLIRFCVGITGMRR